MPTINGDRIHEEKPNHFETTCFKVGNPEKAFQEAKYVSFGHYETQRIEHAFLEKEAAVSLPDDSGGIVLYSQGQGVYEDRRQVALVLGLPEEKVRVIQVSNGGGFGGKEDLSVQGHCSLFAFLLKKTCKNYLNPPGIHPAASQATSRIYGYRSGRR